MARRSVKQWICWAGLVVVFGIAPAIAQVSIDSETIGGIFDADKVQAERAALAAWLISLEDASIGGHSVTPDPADLARLEQPTQVGAPVLVGVNAALNQNVSFDNLATSLDPSGRGNRSGGRVIVDGERLVWFTKVISKGAAGLRLQLVDLELPTGAQLYVYNDKGEAFGPYDAETLAGRGELWTNSIAGEEIRLQLHYSDPNVIESGVPVRFDLAQVAHLGDRFLTSGFASTEAFCSGNASCVENASCSSIPSAIQPARDAVGRMLYQSGFSSFFCSGGLLNDTDTSSTIPYFLTANHCISTSSEASSLEVYFQYSVSCGTTNCPSPGSTGAPRVLGSSILSTSSTSDYTLLQLDQAAPAGSTLLGWTSSAVAFSNNTALYRISHPAGKPQAYSRHSVDTGKPTCGSWPRGDWIYEQDEFGATEGGSSGSPVLNASGQVVGQLSGACGTNPNNACDSVNNATVDGAFAAYYSQIEQWLNPQTGNCHNGSNGSASYCSSSCPCDAGEGDCDSNAECNSGLVCATDTGPNYGFASWVDVCEVPDCHTGAPGSASYCSSSCPCDAGEGDCDGDSQCTSGNECVNNVGPNYGWASWVDVCEPAGPDPNSCVGSCGGQAPGGCWCDSQCASFGDCCADKVSVCG